ncbi:MAG: hypothetical protein ACYTFZ_04550 [Planctomycetota bacterium]
MLDLYAAVKTADSEIPGAGLALLEQELAPLEKADRAKLWRMLLALMEWVTAHRKELKDSASRNQDPNRS